MALDKQWRAQGRPDTFPSWLGSRTAQQLGPSLLVYCRVCLHWAENNGAAFPCVACGSAAVYPPTESEVERFLDYAEIQMETVQLDPYGDDSING